MTYRPKYIFSSREQAWLKDKLFVLLAQRGVRMDHPAALEALARCGVEVDKETKRVRFPRKLLEELLGTLPRTVLLAAPDPRFDLQVPSPEGGFYVRTGTGAPGYLDPEDGSFRRTRITDVRTWAGLSGALEHIDFCAYPSPGDVPGQTADIHALREMLHYCPKHVWVQPYSEGSIEYLFALAEMAAGGGEELSRRPLVSMITCSFTPLDYKYMDLEVVVQACRRGVPLHACSLPTAGGTAPVTMSGTVLLAAAETIALLALSQAIRPGTPGIATPLIFSMDMLTGRSLQASLEAIQGASAAANFIKEAFGLPVHTYGFGADTPDIDGQAQAERSLLSLLAALAGSDILGGAGQLDVATTVSPLQLIVDNDLSGMVRRLKNGLTLNDETLAWDDLLELAPGGHFLEHDHTFRHCRSTYRSHTFVHRLREKGRRDGEDQFLAKAGARYREIMKRDLGCLLSEEARLAMDQLVQRAERSLRSTKK